MTPTRRQARPDLPSRGAAAAAARGLVGLPSRLPLLLFWCTLVVSVTVLLGVFAPSVVLPSLVLLVVVTWRLGPDRLEVSPGAVVGALAALTLAVAWVWVNLSFASEVLLVQRDPGFLTLEGLWLSSHADPDVPLRSAADVVAAVPGVSATSDAFWSDGSVLSAQGAKAFPGLIAMAGWVAGQPGVLAANVVIGGIALLALYDTARRLLSPLWGLLPVGVLASTTPMIYFTRTPFTEPTNIVLTFAGLAVLWGALREPRTGRFALSGALLGGSALSRIDGAAVAAGLVLALGLVAAGARDPVRRGALARGFVAASATALAMVALGYLDVRVNSAGYLADHASLYRPLVSMLVACLVMGALAIAAARPPLTAWVDTQRRTLGTLAGAGVVAVAVLLASRPLWLTGHNVTAGTPLAAFIEAFQATAGVTVDGTRSYDEMTLVWLTWYLGLVTVVLAVLGAALMARESVTGRRANLFVLLVTLGVPSLLYLVRPSITPDQVWAMRRLLPAAVPLVLLCATWPLARLGGSGARPLHVMLAGLAAVPMLLAPRVTWGALVDSVEFSGRAAQVDQLCDAVTGSRVAVVRGAEPPLLPTLRIMCDVDVVEVPAPVDAARLAEIRAAWGGGRVLVAAQVPNTVAWPQGTAPTISASLTRWPHSLTPADYPIPFESQIWLGDVEVDGSVTPVPPRSG